MCVCVCVCERERERESVRVCERKSVCVADTLRVSKCGCISALSTLDFVCVSISL